MEKLKSCPFCGGEAELREAAVVYFVLCHGCSMRTVPYKTAEEAAEVWNRRVKRQDGDYIKIEIEALQSLQKIHINHFYKGDRLSNYIIARY